MFDDGFGVEILVILFFLTLSSFSGRKKRPNKKKTERREKLENVRKNENWLKAHGKETAGSVGSWWNDIEELFTDEGEEDHDPLRNQGSGIVRVKEQRKDREKKAVFPEAIRPLISADHQSGEGISANSDYRNAGKRSVNREENKGVLPKNPSSPRRLYMEDLEDLRRAMILKEILERPLSLRRGK